MPGGFSVSNEAHGYKGRNRQANFQVTGQWKNNTCVMNVSYTGLACPNWGDYTRAACSKSKRGYIKMRVATSLVDASADCSSWFTRADYLTRASIGAVRAHSVSGRAAGCQKFMCNGAYTNTSAAGNSPVSCLNAKGGSFFSTIKNDVLLLDKSKYYTHTARSIL